jgi:hypothetical protein
MNPRATAEKLAVFEKYGVDALVFPYAPTFAQPIKNPVYTIDDPAFVNSDAPVPATMSGYSSVGFPSILIPMGFGSQDAASGKKRCRPQSGVKTPARPAACVVIGARDYERKNEW